MMKKVLILAAFVGALVGAATAISATTTTVSITKAGFAPKNVTVISGDTVKWVNNDTKNQQVACKTCTFTSPVLKPTDSYSFTFNTVGKFAITDPVNNRKGTVTVKAPPATVSLGAKPPSVKYLAATALSGADSAKRANQNVVLLGKACGATTFTKVTTTKTAAGGTFSVTDKPTLNTAYEAKIGTATSKEVTVKVQPTIVLSKLGRHKFSVAVTAASSFSGKQVLFQRRKSSGKWVTVRKVTLTAAAISGGTTTTSANFKSRIRRGRRVRISMVLSQTSPCYAASRSKVIRS
jgi:plastocyanin